MALHAVIFVLHILSAVVWLGLLPADLSLRKYIKKYRGREGEGRLISAYLYITNISGMIGMTGVLLTGVILTFILPYYSFFDFSTNHWLAAKQVVMVILLVLVFAFLIPKARQVRTSIKGDLEETFPLNDETYRKLEGLKTIVTISNLLVLLNFLFALTRRFIGA